MLDHVALQVKEPDLSAAFYVRVFAAIGVMEAMRVERPEGSVIGLSGPDGFPHLWLGPLVDPGHRPIHLALGTPTAVAVDEIYRAALAEGAEILHEPRLWPEYHPGYYAVFLRDLDGNNIEAVHHTFEPI
jgi:catechol 2,3-dioxygenase-like lactoylglutathione lyase family enzyme